MDPPKPLKRRKPQPKRHLHGGVFRHNQVRFLRLGAHLPQPAPQDALSMSAQTIASDNDIKRVLPKNLKKRPLRRKSTSNQ
jgi:hypothetical protein